MAKSGSRVITQLAVRMIVAVAVAGAAAAWLVYQLDNSYRARTLLILSRLPMEQKDEVPGNLAGFDEPTRRVNYVKVGIAKELPMPDYDKLFTCEEVAYELRERLIGAYREAGIDPGNLTLEKVQRRMEVRSKVHLTTMEEVEYQQVIELMLTGPDPEIIARITNEWAALAIELAERSRMLGKANTVDFLQKRYDHVWTELDEKNTALETLAREWNPEAMTERLQEWERLATEYELQISRKSTELAKNQAALESLAAALADAPPTLTLRKAPPDEAYWLKQKTLDPKMDVLMSESVNPLYARLQEDCAARQSEGAALKAEITAITAELERLRPEIAQLREDLARVARKKEELLLKNKALTKHIEEVSLSLQAARLSAEDTMPEFQVAAKAVAPEEKVAPHRSLIVLAAMFLAAIAAPVHLFGMYALRRYAVSLEKELNV